MSTESSTERHTAASSDGATDPSLRRTPHSAHWGSFHAVVRDGRLVGVEPRAEDPDPAPMLQAMPGMVHGPTRVLRPAIRKGWLQGGVDRNRARRGDDVFVEVPWDEALDLVANELQRVRSEHGNSAIFSGSYGWCSAGRFHHAKTQMQRFINLIGGSTTQVLSYSYAAGQVVLPHVLGTIEPMTGPVSTWDGIVAHTRLMVCVGGIPMKNTQVESGGMATHVAATWLRRAREAGVRFVNISPVRDDTAPWLEAEWIPIRPGTDTALLLAMAWVLLDEKLHDASFLATHCTGFDLFAGYLRGTGDGVRKTPEWAAQITGVPAATIAALAHDMARTRSLLSLAWALQRGEHGEQPYWAAVALAAMLGQIGLPGGGVAFGYGAESGMGAPRPRMTQPTLSAGRNPVREVIPVSRITDLLLHPGESYEFNGATCRYPDTRLIYWCGGNPFHHHQDLNRLADAWRRPDTVIVNECWWTATARHADIVLPATTTLERNDIGAARRDRFIMAMPRAIAPVGQARADFQIFTALAERFGVAEAFTEGRDEMAWLRRLYEDNRVECARRNVPLADFDSFWSEGLAGAPEPERPYTLFENFRRDPEAHPLATPSGRIEICSATVQSFGYDDCPGYPAWLTPREWLGAPLAQDYPLHLISNQPPHRLHSQMDAAGPSKAAKIRDREPITLHPADAAARGIAAGDIVRVFNARGAVLAGAVLSDAVMPGVVRLATGAWYDPVTPQGLDAHGNPNVLTPDIGTSRLAQGPVAMSCLVEVARHDGPLPPVTVHGPPVIEEA